MPLHIRSSGQSSSSSSRQSASHGHSSHGHSSHGHSSHGHSSQGHSSHGHSSQGHSSHGYSSYGGEPSSQYASSGGYDPHYSYPSYGGEPSHSSDTSGYASHYDDPYAYSSHSGNTPPAPAYSNPAQPSYYPSSVGYGSNSYPVAYTSTPSYSSSAAVSQTGASSSPASVSPLARTYPIAQGTADFATGVVGSSNRSSLVQMHFQGLDPNIPANPGGCKGGTALWLASLARSISNPDAASRHFGTILNNDPDQIMGWQDRITQIAMGITDPRNSQRQRDDATAQMAAASTANSLTHAGTRVIGFQQGSLQDFVSNIVNNVNSAGLYYVDAGGSGGAHRIGIMVNPNNAIPIRLHDMNVGEYAIMDRQELARVLGRISEGCSYHDSYNTLAINKFRLPA